MNESMILSMEGNPDDQVLRVSLLHLKRPKITFSRAVGQLGLCWLVLNEPPPGAGSHPSGPR